LNALVVLLTVSAHLFLSDTHSYFSPQVHFWFPTAWCWWSVVFLCFTWSSLSVNSTGRVPSPAGVDWYRFSKVSIMLQTQLKFVVFPNFLCIFSI